MSINLLDLAKSSIAPILISKAEKLFGLNNSIAGKAIETILPMLLSGVLSKASTSDGAQSLYKAVTNDSVDSHIVSNFSNLLSTPTGVSKLGEQGGKILGFLFGDKATGLGEQVAHIADIPEQTKGISGLLALAAPAVFGLLKNQIVSHKLSPHGFTSLLSNQSIHLEKSLPEKLAEWLGWGSLATFFGGIGGKLTNSLSGLSNLFDSGDNHAPQQNNSNNNKSGGFWKWLLPLLLLALGGFLFKSCGNSSEPAKPAPAPVAAPAAAAAPVTPSAPAASATPLVLKDDESKVMVENGVVKFYFASGKADLAKGANEALVDVVKGIKAGQKATISGFHDTTGNAAANAELSKKRALAVRDALVALGVSADTLELKKPGEMQGTGSNAEARRVEVTLVK